MRVLIVSDAWYPQVNGVVRTMDTVRRELEQEGHVIRVISPDLFRTVPCPTYPEIRLALRPRKVLARLAGEFGPEAIHIVTEGPLGLAARGFCVATGLPFTTSFHTRFPEYIQARCGLPAAWTYRGLRWFHSAAARTLVATESLRQELLRRGFPNPVRWSRGVDTRLFRPRPKDALDLPRPVFLFVGRVATEKNIEAFLRLDLPGSKLVVGDGPMLSDLRRRYRHVHFPGAKRGEELAKLYAASDVFVFPSRTDTFGLVCLEALASGLPVAAFPVPGPRDVIGSAPVGCLDEDLRRAALGALELDPRACRAYAEGFTWKACAELFLSHLEPLRGAAVPAFG